jgi:hypothetical protein
VSFSKIVVNYVRYTQSHIPKQKYLFPFQYLLKVMLLDATLLTAILVT